MFILAAAATSGRADDICPPAQVFTSVDMQVGGDGRIYVPVKINQIHKSMFVDTGGYFSVITQEAVNQLKLPTRHSRLDLIDVSGNATNLVAHSSFALGNLYADNVDFYVMPDAGGFADDIQDVAGVLAPNLLHSYDVDIDFAKMKFSLLSQDHCDGKAVPWPANTVSVVPMKLDSDNHIHIPVSLDGQELTASLDTGATYTVLNLELAQSKFGLTLGDADTPEFGRLLRSPDSKTYFHRFKTLTMDGIAIANPTVHLIPDLMRNRILDEHDSLKGGSRLPTAAPKPGIGDLILGMNILRQWRIYIAYKEQAVYLAPSPVVISMEPTTTDDQPAAVQGQRRSMVRGAAGKEPH
jgi:predicted aspartyl protease